MVSKSSISIKGPYTAKDLKALSHYNHIDSLACTEQELVTANIAKGFASLQAVKKLWIWSSVTRTAMREIITIPKLGTLDVLEIKGPGSLMNFEVATDLKVFRCNLYMSEQDLMEISKIPNLVELGAQSAEITIDSLKALLAMPHLQSLDLEGSAFDDEMAAIIAQSKQLDTLEIGSTQITIKGLQYISTMKQLKSLDIWAVKINESELQCLTQLRKLEYLSLGGYEDQCNLTYQGIEPILNQLPQLKRLWLEGIYLTEDEKNHLNNKYEYFRN